MVDQHNLVAEADARETPADAGSFMRGVLRKVAATLDLPYDQLAAEYDQVNRGGDQPTAPSADPVIR